MVVGVRGCGCVYMKPWSRDARIVLFLNCMASGVLGVVLTLHSLTFLIDVEKRQSYAVTWIVPNAKGYPCVCGCTFPLGAGRCTTLLLVGIVVAYKAFTLAFRCLKGLRRVAHGGCRSPVACRPSVCPCTPFGDGSESCLDVE